MTVNRLVEASAWSPLDPSDAGARRWLVDELSKAQYRAAQPSWFDELSLRVEQWFGSLFGRPAGTGSGVWLAVAGVVVLAAIVAVAIRVYGMPHRGVRRALAADAAISDPSRSPAQLRAAAERAAAAGEWSLAIIELFRSVAATLDARGIIALSPGTTAHGAASAAARAFPDSADALRHAADAFDAARYLDHPADPSDYGRLRALDEWVRSATTAATAGAGAQQ